VPSASSLLPIAFPSRLLRTRSARPFVLPLATNHLANCSSTALENGLCFNRDLRIQETSIDTLCLTARTRGRLEACKTFCTTDRRVQDTPTLLCSRPRYFPTFQNVSNITTPPALRSRTRGQDGCGLRAASPHCSDPSEQFPWDVEYMELFRTNTNRGEISAEFVQPPTWITLLTSPRRTAPRLN
jgi:hypothetical protein